MDDFDEDADCLNEETFDCAEIGDWENEHEKFVFEESHGEPKSPSADELPKFWQSPNDLSFSWQPDPPISNTEENHGNVIDVEGTLQRLVSEDDNFKDPAILDISRKSAAKISDGLSFLSLRDPPAYPTVPSNLLDRSSDIWSVENCNRINHKSVVGEVETFNSPISRYYSKIPNFSHVSTVNPLLKLVCELQSNSLLDNVSSLNIFSPQAKSTNIRATPRTNEVCKTLPTGVSTVDQNSVFFECSKDQLNRYSEAGLLGGNPTVQNFRMQENLSHHLNNSSKLLRPNYNASNYTGTHAVDPGFIQLPSITQQPYLHPLLLNLANTHSNHHSYGMANTMQHRIPSADDSHLNHSSAVKNEWGEFNEKSGSWMTDFESFGVLLSQLRPLIVSNPYSRDYYFAIRWLKQVNSVLATQTSNTNLAHAYQSALMSIPIPVELESLKNQSYPHQTVMDKKLVVPILKTNLNHLTCATTVESADVTMGKCKDSKTRKSSNSLNSEAGCSLGRFTRSNVHRPRLVAEISLASALIDNNDTVICDIQATNDSPIGVHCDGHDEHVLRPSTLNAILNRRRLLLLAQIERMYGIILVLDEVGISIAKIVIKNDIHRRLVCYQQDLIDRLACELFKTSDKLPHSDLFDTVTKGDLLSLTEELFTVRKGIRLFASCLQYFPIRFTVDYLTEFIGHFSDIKDNWPITLDEAATIFYPCLRKIIYVIPSINEFLATCFPEAADPNKIERISVSKNLHSLLTCQLGLSVIFCLLDACARASDQADPSDFIKFGAFFIHSNALIECNPPIRPLETFPHLASILVLYIKPANHSVLTSEHLSLFYQLMESDNREKSSSSSSTTTTINCIDSNSDGKGVNWYQFNEFGDRLPIHRFDNSGVA